MEIVIDTLNDNYFRKAHGAEAEIYLDKNNSGKALKLFYSYSMAKNRKPIIDYFMNKNIPGTVLPREKVYQVDEYFKGKMFIGYSMNYYKDYAPLSSLLNLDYEKRVEIVKKCYDIFKKLQNKKIYYYDCHMGNFIAKDTDVKLVDMDSAYKEKDADDITKLESFKHLNIMALLFLCSIDSMELYKKYYDFNEGHLAKMLKPLNINKEISKALSCEEEYYLEECLLNINPKTMKRVLEQKNNYISYGRI